MTRAAKFIIFLEPVEVFLGAIFVNREAVLDARDDKCCHNRFKDAVWEAVSCVGETDQYAHTASAQLGYVCFHPFGS